VELLQELPPVLAEPVPPELAPPAEQELMHMQSILKSHIQPEQHSLELHIRCHMNGMSDFCGTTVSAFHRNHSDCSFHMQVQHSSEHIRLNRSCLHKNRRNHFRSPSDLTGTRQQEQRSSGHSSRLHSSRRHSHYRMRFGNP
jgi:hypothetical protein